jgi:hypothetical protein
MTVSFDRSIIGREFDHTVLEPITAEEILEFIAVTGETEPPVSPVDLVAPPTFVVRVRGQRFVPPSLAGVSSGLDAGKDIEFGVPIRPGDVLTSVSTVHDIYEKTGRSGIMSFVVLRTVVTNQRGEQVAVIDQRMMFR